MRRPMTIALALISILLILIPASAQGPRRGGGRDGVGPAATQGPEGFDTGADVRGRRSNPGGIPSRRVLELLLDFSEEQFAELEALLEAHRTIVGPLHQQIRDFEGQLRADIDSGEADPTTVGQLVIELHALRGLIKDTTAELQDGFRTLLTDQQLEILEELGNRRPRRGRRGSRGGDNGDDDNGS